MEPDHDTRTDHLHSARAFGIPCPLCGVTRGVALCLPGRPVEATSYNPLTVPISSPAWAS